MRFIWNRNKSKSIWFFSHPKVAGSTRFVVVLFI
jgi:hypothetical protein